MSLKNAIMVLAPELARHPGLSNFLGDLAETGVRGAEGSVIQLLDELSRARCDYLAMASAFTAIVALDPPHSDETAGLIARRHTVSYRYKQGVVLGLFLAGCWLDGWRDAEVIQRYDEAILQCLPSFLRGDSSYPSGAETQGERKEYKNALSQAVKKWVRPATGQGRRSANVITLVERLLETFPLSSPSPISLAGLVVDQLCYAEFGNLSIAGRAHALIEQARSLTEASS